MSIYTWLSLIVFLWSNVYSLILKLTIIGLIVNELVWLLLYIHEFELIIGLVFCYILMDFFCWLVSISSVIHL